MINIIFKLKNLSLYDYLFILCASKICRTRLSILANLNNIEIYSHEYIFDFLFLWCFCFILSETNYNFYHYHMFHEFLRSQVRCKNFFYIFVWGIITLWFVERVKSSWWHIIFSCKQTVGLNNWKSERILWISFIFFQIFSYHQYCLNE